MPNTPHLASGCALPPVTVYIVESLIPKAFGPDNNIILYLLKLHGCSLQISTLHRITSPPGHHREYRKATIIPEIDTSPEQVDSLISALQESIRSGMYLLKPFSDSGDRPSWRGYVKQTPLLEGIVRAAAMGMEYHLTPRDWEENVVYEGQMWRIVTIIAGYGAKMETEMERAANAVNFMSEALRGGFQTEVPSDLIEEVGSVILTLPPPMVKKGNELGLAKSRTLNYFRRK